MDGLVDIITGGGMSPAQRVWSALAPALIVVAYPVLGLLVYAVRVLVKGPYRDAEIASRGASALVGMEVRHFFSWLMHPIWRVLEWSALPANALTTLSVLLATAAAVAVGAGRFALGGWLYVFGGLCDFFDGRLARASGTAGPRGAALDSILDRYSDGIILVGLGWYYRDSWILLVIGALMIATFMVSYVRARGESLGVIVKVGLMQRPERIVYLGLAVALAPVLEALYEPQNVKPGHWLAVLGIILIAIATTVTAVHRVLYLLKALEKPKEAPSWTGVDRGSLIRFSVSSALATGMDFLVVMMLVSWFDLIPWLATFLGCGVGAVINFTTNRLWTFHSDMSHQAQMSRYGFVSSSSALLNAGGVAVLMILPALDFRIAWGLVRAAVFLFWNYPLNRDYVFAHTDHQSPSDEGIETDETKNKAPGLPVRKTPTNDFC